MAGCKSGQLRQVIPARDAEGCVASTVEDLDVELRLRNIPHEIVVVDDGSTYRMWQVLLETRSRVTSLVPLQNPGVNGFGRAVVHGFNHASGDAVVLMMADLGSTASSAAGLSRSAASSPTPGSSCE